MAIVKFGGIVTGARGTIGGLIYSRNKSGPYVKPWARSSNPRTTRQTVHRARLISFSQTWNTLTAGEQLAWDNYANLPAQDLTNSLGDTYSISGYNWFVRINLNLFSAGGSLRVAIPNLGIPPAVLGPALRIYKTGGSLTSRLFVDNADPDRDEMHVFKAALYNSNGRQVASELRNFVVTKTHGISPVVTTFQNELESLFGTIIEGVRVFVSVQTQYSDGRRGVIWQAYDDARA